MTVSIVRSTHSDVLCIKDFQKLFPKFKRNTCDMPILSAVLNLALQLDLKKTLWQLLVDSLEKLWITIPKLFQLLKWSSFIISWLYLLCYLILIVTLWQTNLYFFSLLLTTWGYSSFFSHLRYLNFGLSRWKNNSSWSILAIKNNRMIVTLFRIMNTLFNWSHIKGR